MFNRVLGAGLLVAVAGAGGCLSLGNSAPGVAQVGEPNAPEKLELPPKDGAKACIATAQMLAKNGNLPEAVALYERARTLDPVYETVTRRLAVLHDCLGEFAQADAEYRRALATSPKDSDLWNDSGYSHYCRGNWEAAEDAFRKALELNPEHKRAWVNLGLALAQAGRPDESFEAFAKAVPPAQAHCNVAFALAAQGNREDAVREYQKALELAPDLSLAQTALAKLTGPHRPKAELPTEPVDKPEPRRKPAHEVDPLPPTDPIEVP